MRKRSDLNLSDLLQFSKGKGRALRFDFQCVAGDNPALVYMLGTDHFKIVLARKLIDRIVDRNWIEASETLIAAAGGLDGARMSTQHEHGRLTLEAIDLLATQIVLHHEMFHVICGHVGWKTSSSKEPDGRIEQTSLALEGSALNDVGSAELEWMPTQGAEQLLDAGSKLGWFMEFEADEAALDSILTRCVFEEIRQLLCVLLKLDHGETLSELPLQARVFAFRLTLTAFFQVVHLLDKDRLNYERTGDSSQEHPFPRCRLLAALLHLFELFSGIWSEDAAEPAAAGDGIGASFGFYVEQVVAPVLDALSDSEDLPRLFDELVELAQPASTDSTLVQLIRGIYDLAPMYDELFEPWTLWDGLYEVPN